MVNMNPENIGKVDENHWSYQLIKELNDETLHVDSTEQAVVLKDTFPKSRFHFLVLPRKNIDTIYELTRKDIDLLENMFHLGQRVAISTGMNIEAFRFGFHMMPHMKRLHMHVISNDFDSRHLKRHHHWNIFNTEIFITYDDVVKLLKRKGKIEGQSAAYYEELRNGALRCNACTFSTQSLKELKIHLTNHR